MATAPIEVRTTKPSLLMRAVNWIMARRIPVFPHEADEFRTQIAARDLPRDAPMPNGFEDKFRVERWEAAGYPVVTLHPKSGRAGWHMLYFHGGGFVLPMFKEHWPLVEAMVERCGVSVSVPLYPVVPEHSREEQDALADAAFAKIAEEHDPAKIILNGDSAGGHMVLSLALRLAKGEGPKPAKLALFAPWLDLAMQDPGMEAVEEHDIMLRIGTLRACGEMLAGEGDPASAAFSPLRASEEDLARLPPTRIWTGRHDLFIVDSRSFVMRLRGAGVDAKLFEYGGAPHVFMAVTPTKEAKDTFALLSHFLNE